MNGVLYFVYERIGNDTKENGGGILYRPTPILATTDRDRVRAMCEGDNARYVFGFTEIFWGQV